MTTTMTVEDDPRAVFYIWAKGHKVFHVALVNDEMSVARPACGQSRGRLFLDERTVDGNQYADQTWIAAAEAPVLARRLCERCEGLAGSREV